MMHVKCLVFSRYSVNISYDYNRSRVAHMGEKGATYET